MLKYQWITYILCFALLSQMEATEKIALEKHPIYFHGEKYIDLSTLQDALGVEVASRFAFWKDKTPTFKEKLLPTLPESLESFYRAEGFYDMTYHIETNATEVNVFIEEHTPVRVADINVSSDYPLETLITFQKGHIFKTKEFIAIKSRIIETMLREGYCSYDLDTKAYVDLDTHKVNLRYRLKKGDVCHFGEVSVEGLKSIDKEVVASKIKAVKGERYSTDLIKQSYASLYGLDAFDSVQINYDRKFYNVVPVDVKVLEVQKKHHYRIGVGYDTFVGPRIQGEYTQKNFLGDAQKLKVKAAWSSKEYLLEGMFFKPDFFNWRGKVLDLKCKAGYSNLEYEGFVEQKASTNVALNYANNAFNITAGLALESIHISLLDDVDFSLLTRAISVGDFFLFYPYLHFIYDGRDDKLNPKYGFYLSAYMEYGLSYGEDASNYIKSTLEGRAIYTVANLTMSTVAKVGVIDSKVGELPESKLFFAGGSFSNRAYGFNEMGAIVSPEEYSIDGARTMMNLSFELNYPLFSMESLYGAVFNDNTMLSKESYDFDTDIISSVGVGIRYITPMGPFKLDVGFNTHDTSQYGIQFQIGQSF